MLTYITNSKTLLEEIFISKVLLPIAIGSDGIRAVRKRFFKSEVPIAKPIVERNGSASNKLAAIVKKFYIDFVGSEACGMIGI